MDELCESLLASLASFPLHPHFDDLVRSADLADLSQLRL